MYSYIPDSTHSQKSEFQGCIGLASITLYPLYIYLLYNYCFINHCKQQEKITKNKENQKKKAMKVLIKRMLVKSNVTLLTSCESTIYACAIYRFHLTWYFEWNRSKQGYSKYCGFFLKKHLIFFPF